MSSGISLIVGMALLTILALAFFKVNEAVGFGGELMMVFLAAFVGILALFAYSVVR